MDGEGLESQRMQTLMQKALRQEPETMTCKGARPVRSSSKQAVWGRGREGGTWLAGPHVPCLIGAASDHFQPVFLGLIFQKQESKMLCEISWQLHLKKSF